MIRNLKNKIGWAISILSSLFILLAVISLMLYVNNRNTESIYLRDHPVKKDSTFVLELSYINGLNTIEEVVVPSDAKFYVQGSNGTYALLYNYNIGVPYNGYSDKLIKYGVVNFKVITNDKQ